ncbi:MAG: CDP-alcohol phosphatidyltransferase family protein [Candidatus Dojkabacteria bacterium]
MATLRENAEIITGRIGKLIGRTGVSPNLFSALAFVPAAVAVYLMNTGQQWPAFVFLFFAVIWDSIDGSVARAQNRVTKFGYYIEAVIDKWAEVIMLLGFFLLGYKLEAFIVISGSLVLSYAKPRAAMVVDIGEFDWSTHGSRHERLLLLLVTYLISILLPVFTIAETQFDTISVGLYLIAALVFVGSIQRNHMAKKLIAAGGYKKMGIKSRMDDFVYEDEKSNG